MEFKFIEDPRKSIQPDRTFLTDAAVFKDTETTFKINEYYNLLKDQVAKLDTHIDNVLQKHETDFLNAFKCQMFSLYSQLKELKKKTDDNELKLKRDEQLNKLQTSLDWFREEAVHLGETTQMYKKEIDKWKAKADSLEDDRTFLEEQLKCAKKKIKDLKEAKASHSVLEQLPSPHRSGSISSVFPQFVPTTKIGSHILELLQKHPLKDAEFFYELEKYLDAQETRYKEAVAQAKLTLNTEKKKLQSVSAQQASTFFAKNELEELFHECVEIVRKDVKNRKTKSFLNQKYRKRELPSHKSEKDRMTSSDKKRILELLVTNEPVLVLLYEKLFPHKVSNYAQFTKGDILKDESVQSVDDLIRQVPSRMSAKSAVPQQRIRLFG
jgi:hypothetical protein